MPFGVRTKLSKSFALRLLTVPSSMKDRCFLRSAYIRRLFMNGPALTPGLNRS